MAARSRAPVIEFLNSRRAFRSIEILGAMASAIRAAPGRQGNAERSHHEREDERLERPR
jgi:hypothetical protein